MLSKKNIQFGLFTFVFLSTIWPPTIAHADSRAESPGMPIIQNFSASDYGEEAQVWSAIQDQRGVMYFGLGQSIAQFDGKHWTKISVPSVYVHGLTIDEQGTIYAGMEGDFGYLAGDLSGTLHYISLLDKLPKAERSRVPTIWNTKATSHGVYFFAIKKMYRYFEGELQVIEDETLLRGHTVQDSVYTAGRQKGVAIIHNGRLSRIPYFDKFDEHEGLGLVVALALSNDKALVATTKQGMFIHDQGCFLTNMKKRIQSEQGDKSCVTPFPTEIDSYLQEHRVYSGARINDTLFAFGTQGGGIVVIDNEGRLKQLINRDLGLIDDIVYDLFVDRFGDLWASTDTGISHLMVSSPLTKFDAQSGLDAVVLDMARYKGTLYLGAMNGIYSLPSGPVKELGDNYRLEPNEDARSQCFSIIEHNGTLLALKDQDVVQVVGPKSRVIQAMNQTALSLGQTKKFPEYVFVGLSRGIKILKTTFASGDVKRAPLAEGELQATIVPNERLQNIPSGIFRIVSDSHGDLWASSREKGVYQLRWPRENFDEFELIHYGPQDGLPELVAIIISCLESGIIATTEKGLYKAEPRRGEIKGGKPFRFVKEQTISRLIGEKVIPTGQIKTDSRQNLWLTASDSASRLKKENDGTYFWESAVAGPIADPILDLFPDKDDIVWLTTAKALYRFDGIKLKNYSQDYEALIRRVVTRDKRILLSGDYFDSLVGKNERFTRFSLVQPREAIPVLEYRENGLMFEYSSAFYERPEKTVYKYQLQGFDTDWSDWVKPCTKEYTNLPEGEYAFQVKAKNIYGHESRLASYRFLILPPWYRTPWAYLGYFVVALLFLVGVIRLFTWRLIVRQRKLEGIVKERTFEVVRQKDEIAVQRDQIKQANEALWGEMQLAKKIQTVLLPEEPSIPGYDIAAYMNPATDVGGDYYDVINVRGTYLILIGDVSGHGVPAGLVMMMVQTSIHTAFDILTDSSPAEILTFVNRTIYDNIARLGEEKYMTVTAFSVHENGALYFSGLHQDIMVYRAASGEVEPIQTNGMWLGILDEIGDVLTVEKLTMNPGDTMLLYTDGITEARDSEGNMFSYNKLFELFVKMGSKSVREIEQGILDALDSYDCDDDVTFMIVNRKE